MRGCYNRQQAQVGFAPLDALKKTLGEIKHDVQDAGQHLEHDLERQAKLRIVAVGAGVVGLVGLIVVLSRAADPG